MSYAYCHRILQGLWAAGVRDMVVTPGSRSTPLLLAALDSEMRLFRVIDERSAAFFALGRARARGSKVALLCTSGSAGSHYLPAMLEARYAGHCLIALTADRPPELRHTGANQTIDQRQLFASATAPCVELPVPDECLGSADAASRRVYEAVARAVGPIHINLAFRKPLEPRPGEKIPAPLEFREPGDVEERDLGLATEAIAVAVGAAKRGLIVSGPSFHQNMGPALCHLASRLGFVLLAEGTSGARLTGATQRERVDGFSQILEQPRWVQALAPDLILQFGADPASGPLLRWLAASDARRIRFGEDRITEAPSGSVELVGGSSLAHCEALAAHVEEPKPSEYLEAWRQADEACWQIVRARLDETQKCLTEAKAIATVLSCLPANAQLTVGNSLPIRGIDLAAPGQTAKLRVLHQRGTSGIEGLVAGAMGSAKRGESTVLLIGDVACAHDLSSLALHDVADGPLVIVMIDNGGGKIFSHLPVATLGLSEERWAYWETPPRVDFEKVCDGYGVAYRRCESAENLEDALVSALESNCSTFLHVAVDPNSMRNFLHETRDALS